MTPSERIIMAANAEKTVTDSLGRKLKFRRLLALDRARLFKAMGPVNSQNAPYFGMAMIACSCTFVDDLPLPFPNTDAMIENAISRLGDEGMEAISTSIVEEEAAKEAERAATQDAIEATTQTEAAPAASAA